MMEAGAGGGVLSSHGIHGPRGHSSPWEEYSQMRFQFPKKLLKSTAEQILLELKVFNLLEKM